MSDNGIILPSIIHLNLMRGVLPKKDDTKKIDDNFHDEDSKNLAFRILEQDRQIILKTKEDFDTYNEMNKNFDKCILSLRDAINTISLSVKKTQSKNEFDLDEGVDFKINEFERLTKENNDKIKKLNETIPENTRKRKENDDFFKKFIGEKKVWLDRLKEEELQDDMYSKTGFKYLYEAKIVKLLLEGILLEKVQDMIEKEMCKKGECFGWEIMNEKKVENEKKETDFEFNQNLIRLDSEEQVRQEKDYLERKEKEGAREERKREEIRNQWKQIWREIWIPEIRESVDPDIVSKRKMMIQITMDVTFEMFKKLFFDIYKLKNIILSNDEYVIMDKIRSYFTEKNIPGRTQDEIVLNQLMNIIDSIKAEEEIIYCDLSPAKQKISEYSKSTEKNTTAKQRLELIVEKISEVQDKVNKKDVSLVKSEVEEIRKLISEIPYENERKLFMNNLINSSRLYDTFLPLSNILMVVSFMTVAIEPSELQNVRVGW